MVDDKWALATQFKDTGCQILSSSLSYNFADLS